MIIRDFTSSRSTPSVRESLLLDALDRADACDDPAIWITRLPRDQVVAQWKESERKAAGGAVMPLLGVPYAVKDNIDVAGLPTTAACPDFAYVAQATAPCVQRLIDAGAVLLGKTNLDQFATGLVGTRSPYGACRNAFNPHYISGGSSSGSAVAVARGLVAFALGTDTAGSGRVPAAYGNVVGLKPTRGLIPTRGVVPACRSLDCVSIFTQTAQDAALLLSIVAGEDAEDPFSRKSPLLWRQARALRRFRFGVPREALDFFGDREYETQYAAAISRLTSLGGEKVEIDYAPFQEAAELLYGGPWVAERYAAIASFIQRSPQSLLPVTRSIIEKAGSITAVQTFEAIYRLASLRARADQQWEKMDVLLLPTTGTIFTHDEVVADPIGTNTNLGRYTNFMNLLDCAAVATPSGFTSRGLPFGITLASPAWSDVMLLDLAGRMHAAAGVTMGATGRALPALGEPSPMAAPSPGVVRVAVVGAHLSGQPLNRQLTDRQAVLVRNCRTAAKYRLYALTQSKPLKPGLVHINDGEAGHAYEVEIWDLPHELFGSFVNDIPSPLGIGTLELEDGSTVKGFICEPYATAGATDISRFAGWRAYLQSLKS